MSLLKQIAIERAVGTKGNAEVTDVIEQYLDHSGYTVEKKEFDCKVWKTRASYLLINDQKVNLSVSPYSESFSGDRLVRVVHNLEELKQISCYDNILFMTGELTKEPLQPKDYPFYYPSEHKEIIDLLEQKKPCAIVAVTGSTPMCGLSPFPYIEDGNFSIPVANISNDEFGTIEKTCMIGQAKIRIISDKEDAIAYQIIATKRVENPKGKIVICAHMDSKNNTPGALDNATGVVTMLLAAKEIELKDYDIEIIPFNTEEYYDPRGELIYLDYLEKQESKISLLINIDTVAHYGSKVAVATFNLGEEEQKRLDSIMEESENVISGQPWYAGDHAAFAFNGTQCILIFASDLFEGGLSTTHSQRDRIDLVDEKLIQDAAEFIVHVCEREK